MLGFRSGRSAGGPSVEAAPPRLPGLHSDLQVYCIGDLHGRIDCLVAAHAFIDADIQSLDRRRVIEVYVGDYVDRGPHSAEIIETLIQREKSRTCRFLRGNHERAMSDFLEGRLAFDIWREIGGAETVTSYGLDPWSLALEGEGAAAMLADKMPPAHRTFLDSLLNCFRIESYFFAHAGVRPGVPLDEQTEQDLLWIRETFLQSTEDHGAIIVHGHTPTSTPELLRNRVNVDTGAYATGRIGIARINAAGVAAFMVEGQRSAPGSVQPRKPA